MQKDYLYFKKIHQDNVLAGIAFKIHKLGYSTVNGSWYILRNKCKRADELVVEFFERQKQLQETIYN